MPVGIDCRLIHVDTSFIVFGECERTGHAYACAGHMDAQSAVESKRLCANNSSSAVIVSESRRDCEAIAVQF